MLQIDNDAIYITRGDDAMFRIVLKLNGEVYDATGSEEVKRWQMRCVK